MISTGKVVSLAEAAAAVPDGARIAFGGGGALMRRPMAFARELLRQGRTGLHVHHMLGGLEIDLLVGGGAVASTSCAYLGLLEYGQAPSFQRAVREGAVDVAEYSEFSFIAGLRAADMGLPFLPWKTPWGSDIVTQLELRTVRDPYSDHELLALPATPLDVAVIQVDRSDEEGFVELPEEPDLIWDYDYLIARVARTTIVCAEEIAPPRTPARVALIGREVARVVEVPGGAWPAGMHPRYAPDVEHVVKTYLPAATAGGEELRRYHDAFVTGREEGPDAR